MGELFERYEKALRAKGASLRVPGGSVRISGAGRVSGGVYESVSISGAGKIEGDVEAEEVRVAGSARFHGSVKAGEISLSGSADVEGDVKGGVLKAAGALKVSGAVECEEVRVAGALKARSIKGGAVRVTGAFNVQEDVEAQLVELRLSKSSRCRVLKGDEVKVESSKSHPAAGILFKIIRRDERPTLTVELLEARRAELKGVVIEGRVKADRVELRGGAEVRGLVEGEIIKL